ncbi:MAG: tRNA (adenosine(37)-N6)-threonylcarbamoyltransferase complex ATPase subunit type 1 TsaE [Bacteroidales bacterium]|nr:tRNA (adenosine(37)-N6)-threonylcarbamoyltransferase complex ATPase subunit type 1 TsaE [Bacteroidales bacterium]
MHKTFTITSLKEIDKIAREFIQYISESDLQSNIFAFYGKMGAGKTTFIKAICKALGVTDTVNSPTFTIINEYRSAKGFPIYHFDFYRINRLQEAYDIGVEEYFSGDGLCLIEWPEKIAEILPEDVINVTITTREDLSRSVEIS